MIVKKIKLKRNNPSKITVEMSVEEAAQIVKWSGGLVLNDRTDQTGEIYGGLVTGVFNPYWSDGVDGYLRGEDE